jgi:tetratricopeptide (TPR) repeat protein
VLEGLSPIGLVAAFGLGAVGDVADRAAHAAMAILKAVERARRDEVADIGVRMGLHVATALVGVARAGADLDMDERRDLWPLLDELVERASSDVILVSSAAASFLRRRFELASGPGPASNGDPMLVLVGLERTGLGLGGRLAEFVGRRYEIEVMRSRLESARRGQGQVVCIMGEAGIGKSRLVHEFRQGALAAGVACLDAHCYPYGTAVPYLPVLELVRTICGIAEVDPPDVIGDRVRRTLDDLGFGAADVAPYVLHALGVKHGSAALELEAEPSIRARIFDIVRQILRRRSQRTPLTVVVDDVHWIDQTSEEFFATLVDSIPGAAILLIVTSRPGYRPPWRDKSYATHIALQPLDPDEARQVLRSMLGSGAMPGPLEDAILTRAEGNAFFLEELTRAVREQRGPTAAVVVPDTVQDVLQTRIDRLAVEDRRLLAAAAVIGKDLTFSLLAAALDEPDERLREGLARLQAAEFLYETSGGADPAYSFRHVLTQEVAYGGLTPADRRGLHARIAGALEAGARGRSAEDLARIAHHAIGAERWDLALAALRQAGARAIGAGANREAIACYEQALGVLGHLPTTPERRRDAVDLRLDLRTALLPLGEHERIFTHLREAEAIASELGDRYRLGRVYTYLTNYFFITGDHARALDDGRRALAIAEAVDDFPLRAEANLRLGQVFCALARYPQAADILADPLGALTGDQAFARFGLPLIFAVGCRHWLIRALAELGRFEEGARHGEEAVRLADEAAHPFSQAVAYLSVGHLRLRRGDLERAVDVLERGHELARRWTIQAWVPRLAVALGSVRALMGRSKEALPLLERAVAESAGMRALRDSAWALVALGEALVLAGRPAEATAAAERALEQARALDDRGAQAWAHRLRGESALLDDPGAAAGAFQTALALARELGMRPLMAHCLVGLGRGDRETGRDRLDEARRLYVELGMPFWLARASAEFDRSG